MKRRSRRWTAPILVLSLALLALCCVGGAVAASRLAVVFGLSFGEPPGFGLVTAPTTPPDFGLSGQATCRHSDPPTASSWLAVAREDAAKYQLDVLSFEWQIWRESKFNPDAVSSAGAVGIAQFLPDTAASLGIDPKDPTQALDAAAKLDKERLGQYEQRAKNLADHYGGQSAHYGYGLVLAAYNAGAGALESAWRQTFADSWPPGPWSWLDLMGEETQNYVPAILGCL
ncbi:MAG TPA: lytic transglycosylase domain-containing protein [Ktedonobacterales bacterium]